MLDISQGFPASPLESILSVFAEPFVTTF